MYNVGKTINIISKEGWAEAASNIYLLALMVIITTIQSILKYLEKQKHIEASKASIEMAEKPKEEVSANKELCDSYIEIYNAYKEGSKTKEDLYDITTK